MEDIGTPAPINLPPADAAPAFAPDMAAANPATGAATTHADIPGRAELKTNCLSRLPQGLLLALVILVSLVVILVVSQLCGPRREGFSGLCGGKGRLPLSAEGRDHYHPGPYHPVVENKMDIIWDQDPDRWNKLNNSGPPDTPTWVAGASANDVVWRFGRPPSS